MIQIHTKNCKKCNMEFKKPINCSLNEWISTRKFCSKICGYLSRDKGKRVLKCETCKHFFSGSRKEKPRFCNNFCKNRAWRGGINPKLNKAIRSIQEYTLWRKKIMERDNFTCTICANTHLLEVHHKESLVKIVRDEKIDTLNKININSKLWDLGNGVVLCKNCHKLTDSYMKRFNKVQFT